MLSLPLLIITKLQSYITTSDSKRYNFKSIGITTSIGDGIAKVYGITHVQAGELVIINNLVKGMALNLEEYSVGIVLFGNDQSVNQLYTIPSKLVRYKVYFIFIIISYSISWYSIWLRSIKYKTQ